MSSTPALRRTLLIFLAALVGLGVVGYGFFEARRLVQGPRITILTPTDGSATSSPAITIAGLAENVSFLSINDRPILTDEAGYFSERMALPPGRAIFFINGKDRFGRSTSHTVHITIVTYCPVSTT